MQDFYNENYTLELFSGQGVKHALGFGLVVFTYPRDRKALVQFESGAQLLCGYDNLAPARPNESEHEFLLTKPYPLLEAEAEARAHSSANFREAAEGCGG